MPAFWQSQKLCMCSWSLALLPVAVLLHRITYTAQSMLHWRLAKASIVSPSEIVFAHACNNSRVCLVLTPESDN